MKPLQLSLSLRTRCELCNLMSIGKTTLYRRINELKKLGTQISNGKLLSPEEQKVILEYCGFGPVMFPD